MGAYITGMIAGTIALVFPLLYLMNIDRCVAKILAKDPAANIAGFLTHTHTSLAYLIAVIGGVVLLMTAVMSVLTGLWQIKQRREKLQGAAPAPATENELPAP
ncbi:MAG: hypothetical protein KAX44_03080 [Candidatus Brocadiae bacterium]|nr:hypothetical protein [Candidatus Brocadiia bacterium]